MICVRCKRELEQDDDGWWTRVPRNGQELPGMGFGDVRVRLCEGEPHVPGVGDDVIRSVERAVSGKLGDEIDWHASDWLDRLTICGERWRMAYLEEAGDVDPDLLVLRRESDGVMVYADIDIWVHCDQWITAKEGLAS